MDPHGSPSPPCSLSLSCLPACLPPNRSTTATDQRNIVGRVCIPYCLMQREPTKAQILCPIRIVQFQVCCSLWPVLSEPDIPPLSSFRTLGGRRPLFLNTLTQQNNNNNKMSCVTKNRSIAYSINDDHQKFPLVSVHPETPTHNCDNYSSSLELNHGNVLITDYNRVKIIINCMFLCYTILASRHTAVRNRLLNISPSSLRRLVFLSNSLISVCTVPRCLSLSPAAA